METRTIVYQRWEDVVFAHRNKGYGAYVLRRDYARRVLSGAGLTVALMFVLLFLQNIGADRAVPADAMPPVTGKGIFLEPPPSILDRRPPMRSVKKFSSPKKDIRNVLITTDEVMDDDQAMIVEDFLNGDDLAAEGVFGIPEGSGTFAVPEPEAVIVPVVRDIAEVMPQYEGGLEAMMKFIQKKIRYPRAPKALGIDGTVYVRFVVRGDGSVTDVEVIRGVHPDYDREAVRVISLLPSWKGGSHNGVPVPVRMVLPIKFNLQ